MTPSNSLRDHQTDLDDECKLTTKEEEWWKRNKLEEVPINSSILKEGSSSTGTVGLSNRDEEGSSSILTPNTAPWFVAEERAEVSHRSPPYHCRMVQSSDYQPNTLKNLTAPRGHSLNSKTAGEEGKEDYDPFGSLLRSIDMQMAETLDGFGEDLRSISYGTSPSSTTPLDI